MTRKKVQKPRESKATRMRRRREMIKRLYLQRYSAVEIAEMIVEAGEYEGTEGGALRSVQREVQHLRESSHPEAILALQRPAEVDRYRKGLERLFQIACNRAEDYELVAKEVCTPKGDVVTVNEDRTPPQSRDRNLKIAADILKNLGKLDNLITEKGQGMDLPQGESEKDAKPASFIQFSGRPQEYLIAENLDSKDVN